MFRSASPKFLLITILVLGVMLFTTTAVAQSDEVVVPVDGEIVIGHASALTGEGLAPIGINILRGAELALESRPVAIVDGVEFPIVLDPQDDVCSAEGGLAVANRFVADETVVAVIGPMCSSACFAAAPIFDSAGYTSISPSCTNAFLTLSGFDSFNRSTLSDGFQGVLAAEFIVNELGVTRIATVHDGSPYAEGLAAVVAETIVELGGEVVATDAVTVGDTNFRPLLESIAMADPELIYFPGFPAESARLIQQLADVGLEDVIFMSADGTQTEEVIRLAGEAAEGIIASAPVPEESEALEAFLERYVEVYGEEPPGPYHNNSYDAFHIFVDAIEAVGVLDDDGNLVISRSALSEYVRTYERYEGITGVLSPDGSGEMVRQDVGFFQVEDGDWVLLLIMGSADDDMDEEDEDDE
jgi:branched-chain amino acid transport system substrate-binding protein